MERISDYYMEPDKDPFRIYDIIEAESRSYYDLRGAVVAALGMDIKGYELATDFADDNSTETKFAGGFEVEFYRYLRDALNFTEKAVKATGYVRQKADGFLTGSAGQIHQGEADICISSTEFLKYRLSAPNGISYLIPTFSIGMRAYFKQPPASSVRDVFIGTFPPLGWLLTLIAWILILLSIILAYSIYFRNDEGNVTNTNQFFPGLKADKSSRDRKMSQEVPMWVLSAACQQGWYFSPDFGTVRIIFITGCFFASFTYGAFSANLVSVLSIEVVPIKSFRDLIKAKFDMYSDAHIPTSGLIIRGLEAFNIIPKRPEQESNVDVEPAFTNLVESRSALISVDDSFYPILMEKGISQDYICKTISSVRFGTKSLVMSMFVKKRSRLRNKLNLKILQMLETGINKRLLGAYFIKASVQCSKDRSMARYKPSTSTDLFTAYVTLFVGIALSVCIIIGEYLFTTTNIGRKCNRTRNRSSSFSQELFCK